jgi:dCMP deaminase
VLLRRDGSAAGVGYNGALPGQPHCAPETCKPLARCFNTRHAERSALDYLTGEIAAAYVTHEPCLRCTQDLIARGCRAVYYLKSYEIADAAEARARLHHRETNKVSWTTMRYVIGIGGLKRSGKDTFAWALRDVATERGMAFASIAFADSLRQAAAAAYGVEVGAFTDDAKKDTVYPEWGITYRQMLLNLGVPATLLGGGYDHWVKRWRIEVAKTPASWWGPDDDGPVTKQLDLMIAVPDVRRLNEAAAIHDAGGVNVLVQRPGVEWNGHDTEALAQAGSEQPEIKYCDSDQPFRRGQWCPKDTANRQIFDAVFCNDSDVVALRSHAERVLDMVLKGAK